MAYIETPEGFMPEEEVQQEQQVQEIAEEVHEEETVADEIVDVAEELALHSIISEERHEEILECLRRLEESSKMESPSLSAIQAELVQLRSELVSQKADMNRILSTATTPTSHEQNESSAQSQENQIEEPSNIEVPEVTAPKPPEKKRARFI